MASSPPRSASLKPTVRTPMKSWDGRRASINLPERFQMDDEDEEDGAKATEEHPETYIQQSVYGIIAAAQSRGQLRPRFQADSGSESDSDWEAEKRKSKEISRPSSEDLSKRTSVEDRSAKSSRPESSRRRQNKSLSENKLLKSFMQPIRERNDSQEQDHMSQSQFLPPKNPFIGETSRPASGTAPSDTPIMDQKLQAQARAEMGLSTTPPITRKSKEHILGDGSSHSRAQVPLPQALAEIFQFEDPEEVISEYPCWYLQSVLLQGYMYITQKHICFYAYLPKKGQVVKSGYLAKQGKRSSRYQRYWFTLKGDVLSYFSSASEPYFPNGTVDLRFAIAADLAPEKSQEKTKDVSTFTVTTENRTYYFRADSSSSAKEWVRQLQKIIFRSRNDGDSVKIAVPIKDIVDVEPNPVLDFAETVKIRVIDSDETYAVDEYFFTFFGNGADALRLLNMMTQDSEAKKVAQEIEEESPLRKGNHSRRRRSVSAERLPRLTQTTVPNAYDPGQSAQGSTESFENSSQNAPTTEGQDMNMSASQILLGDTAFQAPTLRMSQAKRVQQGSMIEKLRSDTNTSSLGTKHIGDKSAVNARLEDSETDSDAKLYHQESESIQQADAATAQATENITSGRPMRTIANPLQHAFTLAGVVRNHGKRMSSYLSGSPKNYYDKLSGAIAGGKRHYANADILGLDDNVDDPELDMETVEHERRFQQHFALPSTERLRAVYYCWLHRVLPLYGKIYLSDRRFCFRSLLPGTRTKLVVPFKEVDNVTKEKGFRWGYPGMVLVIRGHEELFLDFGSADLRDDCVVTVLRNLDVMRASMESTILTEAEQLDADTAAAENEVLQGARNIHAGRDDDVPQDFEGRLVGGPQVLFDDPSASLLDFKPKKSLRITCLTIGSRGDVQPYIALCKGLIKEGHQVKIATHAQFEGWVRKHGVGFTPVNGDPAELMRMCVENGMFTPSFLYEAKTKFRAWLDELLETSWEACQNSDLLIESPSAMAGIHIAESLGIPYFRAFTMPWTKTRAYPHAFATQGKKMGGQYNYTSYTIFDFVFWQAIASQINRWRRKTLNLKPTDHTKLQTNKVPFLYNFSPSVVPPPLDFSDWIRITGYWFLDEAEGWEPPRPLLEFIKKARSDNMKLVYIGFGSVPVADSKSLTQQIVDAVVKADVRCIMSKGWSDHFAKEDPGATEIKLPSCIFQIRSAPHDWLFKQIDAAVHHGGAGTTGASLRAGVPTVVKPFFGDQFFFASRVEDLGVGMHLKKISVNSLGKALWWATHDERMRTKARLLGEQIRRENGVETAINAIYRDLEYAKTLIKKRDTAAVAAGEDEDTEESWTFIENDALLETEDLEFMGTRRGIGAWPQNEAGYARSLSLGSMAFRGLMN